MPAALFTNGQSRWALHILVALLSIVAIASSAPSSAGGATMFSGHRGDIRGLTVVMGAVGLAGVVMVRAARILLPVPWRIYIDRVEFTLITMLWVLWTSATMAFSAFILQRGVCSSTISTIADIYLPNCQLLTFDLALLHLLSTCSFALLLVIFSTALSPSYYLSLSPSLQDGADGPKNTDATDGFIMWDLALASPPPSPRPDAIPSSSTQTYGTTIPATPIAPTAHPQPSYPMNDPSTAPPPRRKDKFAEGRVWSYLPLGSCSLGVMGTAGSSLWTSNANLLVSQGYRYSSVFIISIGAISGAFAFTCLIRHYFQRSFRAPENEKQVRNGRALEVVLAGTLFLLWPLAAIVFTLFPPTINRPCANPSISTSPALVENTRLDTFCRLTSTAVTLAWMAAWIVLARVMGLIFPMPEMGKVAIATRSGEEEGISLLRGEVQVGYGRIVAGEAFELGDDED